MQQDEVPPEYLWEDPEGLEQWWKRIEEKRSDGRSDPGSTNRADGDDDEHHDPGMAENTLARSLKQG